VHNIHQKFDRQRERTESKSIIIVISQHKDPLNKSSINAEDIPLHLVDKGWACQMSHKFSLHLVFISKLPFQKPQQEKSSNNWLSVEHITNNITLKVS